ncbi:hypothetical protein M8J77_003747 [Diaphorina citri]|nr:hypothetical protein M8J77_003747 [Diaphorina citri]
MEGLKKERSMLRTSLTKASKNIKAILQKDCLSEEDGSDLESILSVMSQRYIEVRDKDKVILENLSKEDADEGTLEEEQEKVDHYCLLYEQARLLVEKALRVNQVVEAASPPHSEAVTTRLKTAERKNHRKRNGGLLMKPMCVIVASDPDTVPSTAEIDQSVGFVEEITLL